jgi:2-polyprenyl-6-methoxyphenol hydroxylase-like FAD-dependent oxidoreductase
VIGADGYDSAVRRMAGIEMAEHGGGQVFSVYEIEATGELPAESARHSRSRPDERLLATRGRAMPLGISDPGRLGTRGIDGAARAADRGEGSLVDRAANRDLLVNARPLRVAASPRASAREASGSPGTPRTRRLRSASTA